MQFRDHTRLKDQHAFLSASQYHWLNYDEDKIDRSYIHHMAKQRGTELHAFAAKAIELGVRLPKSRKTLNMYVNDAIGYRLTPEQVLYYSDNCFGTADAIGFRNKMLRIHDLKTGETKANPAQLKIYEALFCLEYGINPEEIDAELRIYQYDDIFVVNPDPEEIRFIMNKIIVFDRRIDNIKNGEW